MGVILKHLTNFFCRGKKENIDVSNDMMDYFNVSPELELTWYLVYSDGFNNKIYSTNDTFRLKNPAWLSIKGKNNRVFLCDNSDVERLNIKINGNSCKIYFGSQTSLNGSVSITGHQRTLVIGNKTTFQSVSLIIKEGHNIFIGEDCMFSSKIEIRTSDSHSIYDVNTGERLNKPGDVLICDHVWLGKDVIVSKGVVINENCVVGAKSFVNKSLIDSNCLYAGVPAKKIRSNINWTRELLPFDN